MMKTIIYVLFASKYGNSSDSEANCMNLEKKILLIYFFNLNCSE